ncbi:MAG: hypothetical protein DRO88_02925 [Promethearchaeia archaeon]|nr:MAG: hypothetical protein DRO88_02925 [Candidatus Lokiarchaeia archaeon]
MTELAKRAKIAPERLVNEISQLSRQIHSVSDVLDYTWEQIIPKIAKEHTDEYFSNGQKIIKYIFRYLI